MISDRRELGSSGATNFRVEHFERVRTIEASGQSIAHAVLADLAEQLRVLQRHGQQCGRRAQDAALMIGQRWLRCHAQAHPRACRQRSSGNRFLWTSAPISGSASPRARRAARSRSAGKDSPTAMSDSQWPPRVRVITQAPRPGASIGIWAAATSRMDSLDSLSIDRASAWPNATSRDISDARSVASFAARATRSAPRRAFPVACEADGS